MTWTAALLPDDALDPESLVGRMLNPEPVRPELIADAMQFMDDYADDFKALAAIEKAERDNAGSEYPADTTEASEPPATVKPMPLWRVMHDAYWTKAGAVVEEDFPPPAAECTAAEIEALRDMMLPEEPPAPDYINSDIGWIVNTEEAIRCNERQRLRAQLTEQARIARGHP